MPQAAPWGLFTCPAYSASREWVSTPIGLSIDDTGGLCGKRRDLHDEEGAACSIGGSGEIAETR